MMSKRSTVLIISLVMAMAVVSGCSAWGGVHVAKNDTTVTADANASS